ncbi:MAG TPA: hypothetical protein VFF65_07595 [Phycisphaerales bacterium]|nr:hypothetical protein [Phycisphaerales bacterium]
MATRHRIESSSTSASLNTNWGGTTPVSGDTAVIAYDCTLSTDLNMNAVDLASLIVANGVRMSAGDTSGNAWQISVDGAFQYFGAGSVVRMSGSLDQVEWNPSANTQLIVTGGDVTLVIVAGGVVEIGETCDWDAAGELVVLGGSVTVKAKAADVIPTIRVEGGVAIIRRDFTNAYVSGGRLEFDAPGVTGGDVHTGGGTFKWIDGNLGTIHGRSGELDSSKLRVAATATAIHDYPGLTERTSVGALAPVYGSRTTYGRGSTKVRG